MSISTIFQDIANPRLSDLSDRCATGPTMIDVSDRSVGVKLMSADEEVSRMLAWYRSRELELITLATHWFVSIDIQAKLKSLIEDLRDGDLEQIENAKRSLATFSELALKPVVALLDDPELHRQAAEILSRMDSYVLPHLLRWLDRSDSYNIRVGIYRALVGHIRDFRAKRALAGGLRSSDPLEAAFVCQTLRDAGPQGDRILKVVFEPEETLAA